MARNYGSESHALNYAMMQKKKKRKIITQFLLQKGAVLRILKKGKNNFKQMSYRF